MAQQQRRRRRGGSLAVLLLLLLLAALLLSLSLLARVDAAATVSSGSTLLRYTSPSPAGRASPSSFGLHRRRRRRCAHARGSFFLSCSESRLE